MFGLLKKVFEKSERLQVKITELQNKIDSLQQTAVETEAELTSLRYFYVNVSELVEAVEVDLIKDVKNETLAKVQHIVEFYKAQLVKVKKPRAK